jgi:hypothetical protein
MDCTELEDALRSIRCGIPMEPPEEFRSHACDDVDDDDRVLVDEKGYP